MGCSLEDSLQDVNLRSFDYLGKVIQLWTETESLMTGTDNLNVQLTLLLNVNRRFRKQNGNKLAVVGSVQVQTESPGRWNGCPLGGCLMDRR
jgi:hypothetical protein